MIFPNPAVMDHLVQHQRRTLRIHVGTTGSGPTGGLRTRVGHLLIVAGRSLGGEAAERPARSATSIPRTV